MEEFFRTLFAQINVTDFIDVAIIAFIIYNVLRFIRETRAEQLVKGLLILVIAMFLSGFLHLYALNWLLRYLTQFGIIALVIVFQPELRRALEYLGRARWFRGRMRSGDKEQAKSAAAAITAAVRYFSSKNIGALIIIEREVTLNDFAETGVILNSTLTPDLLENIFYEGAPLHDGAVIVSGGRIRAAACVLPLTRNRDLPSELGMRHRAGIGITEVSDAFAVITSEETGIISTAQDGKLTRFIDARDLEKSLLDLYLNDTETLQQGFVRALTNRVPQSMDKRKTPKNKPEETDAEKPEQDKTGKEEAENAEK